MVYFLVVLDHSIQNHFFHHAFGNLLHKNQLEGSLQSFLLFDKLSYY